MMISQFELVRFTEVASNRTLQVVQQDPNDCAVGKLEMVEEQSDSSLFRVYDHFSEQYFTHSPECCV